MASESTETAGRTAADPPSWALKDRKRQLELAFWVVVPLCMALILTWKWPVLAGSLAPVAEDDTANAAWRVTMSWVRWSYMGLYVACGLPGYVFLARGPARGSTQGGTLRKVLVVLSLLAGAGTGGVWAWGLPGATGWLYLLLWGLAVGPGALSLRVWLDRAYGEAEAGEDAGASESAGRAES